MSWIDAFLMDYASKKVNQETPKFNIKLSSIDGRGIYPRAIFSIVDNKYSESALKAITDAYKYALANAEKSIEFLVGQITQLMHNHPKYHIDHPQSTVLITEGNLNINIDDFKIRIEGIQKIVENADEKDFLNSKIIIVRHGI